MSDKTEIVYEAINGIREALDAQCTPISELPEMVRTLVNDTSRNGLTTAFVFSSVASPTIPSAKKIDLTSGLIKDLDEGWSQTGVGTSTYNVRRSQSDTTWMSFAIFDAAGEILTDWSIPTNIKGARGAQGDPGIQGATGAPGAKGDPGLDGVVYRTAMAYTTTSTTDQPLKPTGGFWDMKTNEVTDIKSDDGCIWVTNSDLVDKEKTYRWISEAIFEQSGYVRGEWSTPFRLTGADGKDGKDGETIEFIYRLLPDVDTYIALKQYLTENKLFSSPDSDFIPEAYDGLTETKWTDSPKGITEELQVEVVCSRSRRGENENWGEWTNCVIWSKWGEDGTDGDGVEYIYLVTPKRDGNEEITSEWVKKWRMPDLDELMNHPRYQEDEFCINSDYSDSKFTLDCYDWTDEPSDVGPNEPMEWVSVRKKSASDGRGKWGKFSDPKLWATYSEDGAAYITSYVFTRSSEMPELPEGGDFFDPNPTNTSVWHDTVPDGKEPVWMSTRTFCSDPNNNIDDDWTDPKILSDSPNFQVEYTRGDENGEVNKQFLTNLNYYKSAADPEAAWREDQLKHGYVWGDDISDPIWMATASYTNGSWTDWVLTKIKGEKGEVGESGSSVSIKFKCLSLESLLAEWADYVLGHEYFFGQLLDGDKLGTGTGVYVEELGLLYVYSGGYYPGEDTDFDKYWTSVKIKGEPGDSAYLYTAFADEDPVANPYAQIRYGKNATPGIYIGFWATKVIVADDSVELSKATNYVWQKWRGEDGWGYEQVFVLTTGYYNPETGNHPPLPLADPNKQDQVKDYLPYTANFEPNTTPTTTWQDSPQTVSETYPYCWVATRKASDKSFGEWTSADKPYAALYSRWSHDGASAINVTLTNDLAVIPMEEGIVDPDFLDEIVTTSVQVFCGDEAVSSEHIEVTVDGKLASVKETLVTMNLRAINADTTSIPIHVRVNGKDDIYVVTWNVMVTDTAYEIEPTTYSLRRYTNGDNAGKLDKTSIDVYLYKWNGKKWVESSVPLFGEARTIDGQSIKLETGSGIKEGGGNRRIVDLEKLADISYIDLFVVQKEEDGKYLWDGTRLSWERISVVADGLNGGKLEVSIYPDMISVPIEGDIVDPEFVKIYNSENPIKTQVTVRKEGVIVPNSQATISIENKLISDNFEILTDQFGYQTGTIIVKDPNALIGIREVPIKVVPKWDNSDSRIVTWRFNCDDNAYLVQFSEGSLNKDPYTRLLLDDEVSVIINKWGGTTWEKVLYKTLFVKVNTSEGTTLYKSSDSEQSIISLNADEAVYSLKFGNIKDIISVDVFVTDTDLEDGFKWNETLPVHADGQNSFYIELTPDAIQIPLEGDSIDKDYTGECKTEVVMFDGEFPVPLNDYTITTDNVNCTATKNIEKNCWEVSYDLTKGRVEEVIISASYKNTIVHKKIWKISYTEYPYRILMDQYTIKIDDLGKPESKVSGKIQKWNGTSYVNHSAKLEIEFYEDVLKKTSKLNSDGSFDVDLATEYQSDCSKLKYLIVKVVDGTTLLINETVGIIQDGTSPFTASLNPDWIQIPVENGKIDTGCFGQTFKTKLNVYHGDRELSTSKYSVKVDGANSAWGLTWDDKTKEIGFVVSESNYYLMDKQIGIDITIADYNETIKKYLTLDYSETAYRVYLNADPIRLDEKDLPMDLVSGKIEKWNNQTDKYEGCSLSLKVVERDGLYEVSGNSNSNGEFNITLPQTKPDSLMLYGYNTNGEVVISEPIGVVHSTLTVAEREIISSALSEVSNANFEQAQKKLDEELEQAQKDLDEALKAVNEEAEIAKKAAQDAAEDAAKAEQEAEAANKRLDSWTEDNIISVAERSTIEDELKRIEADKNDIDKQVALYDLEDESTKHNVYTSAYNAYHSSLKEIVDADSGDVTLTPEKVTAWDDNQDSYYEKRTDILEAIAKSAKKVADDAQKTADDTKDEIAGLALTVATKTEVSDAIDDLQKKYFKDGKIIKDVLNDSDIYVLSLAALGVDAVDKPGFNPETDLAADNIFAQSMNAVLGRFVKIKAEHIEAGVITGAVADMENLNGLSIWSNNTYETSKWGLNKDGSGKIANGQILWKTNGDVELGSGVKIQWGNVEGKPTGVSKFKSTVFLRSNVPPTSAPTGGSYDSPKPTSLHDGKEWTDGIPAGDAILWASTCEFAFGDTTANWTMPRQMTSTNEFQVRYCPLVSDPGTPDTNNDWSETASTDTIWMATRIVENGDERAWTVSKIKGEKGESIKGDSGIGISSTTIQYGKSASASDKPSDWYSDIPEISQGDYLWTKTTFTYTEGAPHESFQCTYIGKNGDDGIGISSTDVTYASSSSNTDIPDSWSSTIPDVSQGEYLWTKTTFNFTKGQPKEFYSVSRMGKDGLIDANDIKTAFGDYQITSNTIRGKTMESAIRGTLENGTEFYNIPEDGTLPSGKTTADDSTQGPLWQICDDGSGYFGKGHITFGDFGIKIDGMDIMNGIWGNENAKASFKQLAVENLSVKKLNTVEDGKYGAGTISIEGNDIRVFDDVLVDGSPRENLRITGKSLPIPAEGFGTTITLSGSSSSSSIAKGVAFEIANPTLSDDFSYSITKDNVAVTINYTCTDAPDYLYAYCIISRGTPLTKYANADFRTTSPTDIDSVEAIDYPNLGINTYTYKGSSVILDDSCFGGSSDKLYLNFVMWADEGVVDLTNFTLNSISISGFLHATPNIKRVQVTKDGFAVYGGNEANHVKIESDSTFEVLRQFNGRWYGLKVDTTGVWIMRGETARNQWKTL